MTQKPREHLELSRTCRNDVGASIDPSATASPYFLGNPKNSTSQCCIPNLEMKPMWTPNYQILHLHLALAKPINPRAEYRVTYSYYKNVTHFSQKFLLWCDEDCGYFFDDPIVKEGILLRFVSGNFQKIRKNPPRKFLQNIQRFI